MGVVCVINFPLPEGKSGQQTVDMLQKRIETLGATKTGNFVVDCETYQSQQPAQQRVMHVLHNSEHPATAFAILDTGTCLVADNTFDQLIHKLKAFYAPKKNAKVETKGQRYEIGDFIVKIGSVVLGQNISFKGILVEVEYCPCVVPGECWGLMQEFMQGFLGNIVDSPPPYLKDRLNNAVIPSDTVMQYLEFYNNFRKAAGQQQQQQQQQQQR